MSYNKVRDAAAAAAEDVVIEKVKVTFDPNEAHRCVANLMIDTDGYMYVPKVFETDKPLTYRDLPHLPRRNRAVYGELSNGTIVRGFMTLSGKFVLSMPYMGREIPYAVLVLPNVKDRRPEFAMWFGYDRDEPTDMAPHNVGLDEKAWKPSTHRALAKALQGRPVPKYSCVRGLEGLYGPSKTDDGVETARHVIYMYTDADEETAFIMKKTLAEVFDANMAITMPKFKRWDQERQLREAAEAAKAAKGPPAKGPPAKGPPAPGPPAKVSPAAAKAAADADAAKKAADAAKKAANKAANAAKRNAPFHAAKAAADAAKDTLEATKVARRTNDANGRYAWLAVARIEELCIKMRLEVVDDRVRVRLDIECRVHITLTGAIGDADVEMAEKAKVDAIARQTAEVRKLNGRG